MSNEAREVVVLEIGRKKKSSKLRRVPNDETVLAGAPRNDAVCRWIVHHLIGFQKKWCRATAAGGWRCSSVHFRLDPFRNWALVFLNSDSTRQSCKRRKISTWRRQGKGESVDFNAVSRTAWFGVVCVVRKQKSQIPLGIF